MKIKIIPILLLLTACSTTEKRETFNLDKKTLKDQVSVHTVIMQAHAAYIRGCLIERQKEGYKKSFKYCKKKADLYIESDVVSILKN